MKQHTRRGSILFLGALLLVFVGILIVYLLQQEAHTLKGTWWSRAESQALTKQYQASLGDRVKETRVLLVSDGKEAEVKVVIQFAKEGDQALSQSEIKEVVAGLKGASEGMDGHSVEWPLVRGQVDSGRQQILATEIQSKQVTDENRVYRYEVRKGQLTLHLDDRIVSFTKQ